MHIVGDSLFIIHIYYSNIASPSYLNAAQIISLFIMSDESKCGCRTQCFYIDINTVGLRYMNLILRDSYGI